MNRYTIDTRRASYDIANGGSVHARRIGIEVEFEYRNALGETVATVRMSAYDARRLISELEAAIGRDF